MEIGRLNGINSMPGAERNTATAGTEDPLKRAAMDFESLFIGQMFQAMRNSVQESGLFGNSSGQKMFRDMLDQEVAKEVAQGGGLGIGEALYRQLGRAEQKAVAPAEGQDAAIPGERIDENR